MGTIINEIESRVREKKRKNTYVIPSPSHKAYLKKLKKGPSPKEKKPENMTDRLEKLDKGQEELITKHKEFSEKIYTMMENLLSKTDAQTEQTKKDNTLVVGKIDDLEKIVVTLESRNTLKVNPHS